MATESLPYSLMILCTLAWPPGVIAGQVGAPLGGVTGGSSAAEGTLASPIPPATILRTSDGAVTVRAVRISEPIRMDGHLDERVYEGVPALSGFIQQEPQEGAPATESTDAWIFFDDENIYVSARCWDSRPERMVANEMRRDGTNIHQNENLTVVFDTFHDKRNSMFFETNSLGALRDALITDEVDMNQDWNGVWDVKTGKFEGGWTLEMVIPFKTLRYRSGASQAWGVNMRRIVRWKNETSVLKAVPAYIGARAMAAVSFAATLVGLEVPPPGVNLEVKPYGIASLRTDRTVRPAITNEVGRDYGLDVKYGVTKSMTLDLTYNTDFAQVEDDTQQVNLTRFNLFYPERREFFLEGRGIFDFGRGATVGSGGAIGDRPLMFFSRRIGLEQVGNSALPVPIVGGGRLTGKIGHYSVGLLNIQSDDDVVANARTTNFTVLRLKRDILGRSNVGIIYTRRAETGQAGTGQTFGVDALYSRSATLNISGYFAGTRMPGLSGDETSHLMSLDYSTDRYGLRLEQLGVDANFNPQVGFLRRKDFLSRFAQARFSPRPARTHMKAVRRFVYQGSFQYLQNGQGRLDWKDASGEFAIELQNSDRFAVQYNRDYEFIPRRFAIASGVIVPVGGYDYESGRISYSLGTQHGVSGTLSYQQGSLYGGTKRTFGVSSGRVELSARLSLEPTASANWVSLPWGTFTSAVVADRTTLTFNPRMFVSALIQYSSSTRTLSTNTRFRWEYHPGSEMFVVYTDGRDTSTLLGGLPQLMNRAFIIKINRLLRF